MRGGEWLFYYVEKLVECLSAIDTKNNRLKKGRQTYARTRRPCMLISWIVGPMRASLRTWVWMQEVRFRWRPEVYGSGERRDLLEKR